MLLLLLQLLMTLETPFVFVGAKMPLDGATYSWLFER
jgi:hypothetical protein